jgi:uncharacterized protein (DUF486 family)
MGSDGTDVRVVTAEAQLKKHSKVIFLFFFLFFVAFILSKSIRYARTMLAD